MYKNGELFPTMLDERTEIESLGSDVTLTGRNRYPKYEISVPSQTAKKEELPVNLVWLFAINRTTSLCAF